MSDSKYARRNRDCKAAGICTVCRKTPAVANRTKCVRCAAMQVERVRQYRKQWKAENGCVDCGKPRREGVVRCAACQAGNVGAVRRILKARRDGGCCFYCGRPMPPGVERAGCHVCSAVRTRGSFIRRITRG